MNAQEPVITGLDGRVLDNLWAAAIVTDADGVVTYWNRHAERLYGWRAAEAIGRPIMELPVHPDDRALADEIMRQLSAGHVWEGSFRVRHKDGGTFTAAVRDIPLLGPDGEVAGVLGLSVQIGSEGLGRTARAAIAATQLEIALDAADMGVWDWDIATGRITWSPAMEAMFGLDTDTFDGTFDSYIDLIHPDDREYVVESVQQAATEGGPLRIEHRVTWPDGSVHWLEGRGRTVHSTDGTVLGMTGVASDVTSRRQAVDDLSRLLAAEQAARQAAEHAPIWLSQLQTIGEEPLERRTLDQLLADLLEKLRSLLNADTVAILLADEASQQLRVRASLGLDDAPVDVNIPFGAGLAGRVAASGQPVVHDDLSDVEIVNERLRHSGLRSLVAVPLMVGAKTVGVMHAGSNAFANFDDDDAKLLSFVGDRIALAIERVRLLEAEQHARASAERASERLAFLSTATAELSASLDREAVLDRLTRLTVPRMADWCVVLTPDESVLRFAAFRHVDPDAQARLQPALPRYTVPMDGGAIAAKAFRTGQFEALDVIDDPAVRAVTPDPAFAELVEIMAVKRAIAVPLVARRHPAGVLLLAWREDSEPVSWADQTVLRELAARAAVAIENAELYTREHRVAEALQRAILPQRLPVVPGLELAARYEPATIGADVGGDWYDSFELPSGDIAVVVGDVAGHGIMPAAIMGQLRNAVRFYAREGYSPGALLAAVDGVAAELGDEGFGTAIYGVWRPDTGRFRWATAGHPPPVLVSGGTPSFLQEPVGVALGAGAGRASYEEAEIGLEPGSLLVLYTDGLIERRDRGLEEGFRQLATAVTPLAGDPVEAVCERLVDLVTPDRRGDDICILALRVLPPV